MPPGTPLEVLALIPVPPRSLCGLEGWKSSLVSEVTGVAISPGATGIEIGRVSIIPADAGLIVPELSSAQECVFTRLSLSESDREMIGTKIRVKLISPPRPRAWFWLHGIWDNDNRK